MATLHTYTCLLPQRVGHTTPQMTDLGRVWNQHIITLDYLTGRRYSQKKQVTSPKIIAKKARQIFGKGSSLGILIIDNISRNQKIIHTCYDKFHQILHEFDKR